MKENIKNNRPKTPQKEEKPGKHAKMTKQTQFIVARQRISDFTYPNLSHFKPLFEPKKGVLGRFLGQIMVYARQNSGQDFAILPGCQDRAGPDKQFIPAVAG